MIGNDIVCLSTAGASDFFPRPRYLDKVYHPSEQRLLFADETPGRLRWLLWALKESAYKVWFKQSHKRLFAPQKFVVSPLPETGMYNIKTPSGSVFARAEVCADYVVAYASSEPSFSNFTGVNRCSPTEDPSAFVREKLVERVCEVFPLCRKEDIRLEKSPEGIPLLYIRGFREIFDLSLSHHGNFVSYVFTLKNEKHH
ncbi:MAG: 4'-phosphopantetheinyl transferase superfamily protein [Bacteroidia bacterium]|nr:4'-phosphopantetheinyl transferase superfamily protein [Bacteroidia bacterium]